MTAPDEVTVEMLDGLPPLAEVALRWRAAGQPVFPLHSSPALDVCSCGRADCSSRGKHPRTRNGLHDASTDLPTVLRWWGWWEAANVGLPCGLLSDVVDFDSKDGRPGADTCLRLAEAGMLAGCHRIVSTPSGGRHYYFAPSGQGNRSNTKLGMDYRGVGGYVLAPGSVVDGVEYRTLQVRLTAGTPFDWDGALRLLDPPRQQPLRSPWRKPSDSGPASLGGLAKWLTTVQPGAPGKSGRNDALSWAAGRAVRDGLDPWPLLPVALSIGLGEHESRATIGSAVKKYGQGVA